MKKNGSIQSEPKPILPEELKELITDASVGPIEIEFTDVEKQILISAMSEANQSVRDLEQAQQMVQQRRDNMVGATKSADKIYKTIMILKNINPDGFTLGWNPETNELRLTIKT